METNTNLKRKIASHLYSEANYSLTDMLCKVARNMVQKPKAVKFIKSLNNAKLKKLLKSYSVRVINYTDMIHITPSNSVDVNMKFFENAVLSGGIKENDLPLYDERLVCIISTLDINVVDERNNIVFGLKENERPFLKPFETIIQRTTQPLFSFDYQFLEVLKLLRMIGIRETHFIYNTERAVTVRMVHYHGEEVIDVNTKLTVTLMGMSKEYVKNLVERSSYVYEKALSYTPPIITQLNSSDKSEGDFSLLSDTEEEHPIDLEEAKHIGPVYFLDRELSSLSDIMSGLIDKV